MLIKLIVAAILLIFIFKWIHAYQSASTRDKKQKLWQIFAIVITGILILGVVTGRMHWLGAIFAAVIPFLRTGFYALLKFAPLLVKSTGGKTRINTQHLAVILDLNQRRVQGEVINGPLKGKRLEQLNPAELQELADYYQSCDKKSLFFIRALQKGFTEQSQAPQDYTSSDRDEALEILGLSGNPTKEEIIKAHRNLITKLHPDKGGSDFLASMVNQARDTLLKEVT